MNNLAAYKVVRMRQAIEAVGSHLRYLPQFRFRRPSIQHLTAIPALPLSGDPQNDRRLPPR
jgi:hypothetical protein